jgi:hypothetical protein
MQIEIMKVTPEIAGAWLKSNGKNRALSQRHVKNLAESIQKGLWVTNGETICFDDEGRLLDGQHRLHAVVLADKPIEVAVARGVSDPKAFQSYDSVQKVRGAHQIAQMKGVTNSNVVTAAARVVVFWEQSETIDDFYAHMAGRHLSISPQELSDKAVDIEHEYNIVRDLVGTHMLKLSGMGSFLAGVIIILMRIDPYITNVFFEKVRTGIISVEGDPALAYREKLMGEKIIANDRRSRIKLVGMTIKAWNFARSGKKVSLLRFKYDGESGEKLPNPIGSGK